MKAVYAALSYSLALSRCNCCYYSTIPLLILSQANPNHRPIPELAASTDCKARIGCVPSGCFATASFPRYRCQYAYLQRCSLRRVMAKIPNQQVEKITLIVPLLSGENLYPTLGYPVHQARALIQRLPRILDFEWSAMIHMEPCTNTSKQTEAFTINST